MSDFKFPPNQNAYSQMAEGDLRDPKKRAAFEALRRNVRDVWRPEFEDDFQLYRFLRAREFDLAKSELMLRNHIRWRKELRIDDIVDRFQEKEVITKYYTGGLCGEDKEGRPVYYDPIGCIDPQGIAKSVSREELFLSQICRAEKIVTHLLPQVRARTGKAIYGVTFVYDLQHFGKKHMWRPSLEFYGDLTRTCEQNYPETIGIVFIINAPAIFPVVFNLLKPLFNPATQAKIHVLGKDYQRTLLQYIDADQLPAVYGGERRDPDGDPRCLNEICFGGLVPESFYLQPKYPDCMQSQHIGRRSKFRAAVTVPAGQPQRYIEWDFVTSDGDLGFELTFKDGKERLSVYPYRKVNCGTCPFSGLLACPRPGVYEATFDNSFSWLRTKKLRYYLEVVTDLRGQEPIDPAVLANLAPSFHVSESVADRLEQQGGADEDSGEADGPSAAASAAVATPSFSSNGKTDFQAAPTVTDQDASDAESEDSFKTVSSSGSRH
ncbi:hypothetical protein BOX15_Mlig016597g1 [Macrostomum lignano]|uniref:CRAL-TRIO domain-containing protein n=1 Tax=Macrostomum lignano TaxID=282301 RepID=A0A267EWF8_9PLAT|nr:hypothetical protein BOX15_Mlig016597g1 [Macrostomum lignano]